ncbi:MAG: NAD-binding protein [Clostridia bacterium]|nr:NAD-binding protein [Clostridia bacterium]
MKRVLIIGGDNRLRVAKKQLDKENFLVDTLGLYPDDNGIIEIADIILLPVPTTKDGQTVFSPLTNRKIYLDEINRRVNNQLILCCNYKFDGKNYIDYNQLDSFALLNAVPTAEGAIALAINETDFTLWESKILVIGYGRVGKIVADRLKALGARVTVSARKPKDFATLSALGFKYINTETLCDIYLDYDIIFNTVDVTVLSESALQNCPADLIIDLSSKGGFNLNFAKALGIKAFKPGGIPGVCAPKTAGKILAETVRELI